MYATLLADTRFHELLLSIDRDLADTCRAGGCLACGGRLHSARYPRKRRRLTPRTTGDAERAEARVLDREIRSYEAEYVNVRHESVRRCSERRHGPADAQGLACAPTA